MIKYYRQLQGEFIFNLIMSGFDLDILLLYGTGTGTKRNKNKSLINLNNFFFCFKNNSHC